MHMRSGRNPAMTFLVLVHMLRSIQCRLPFGYRLRNALLGQRQTSFLRLLQKWLGAGSADAAGDFQTGDATIGRGVVLGKRISRSLTSGEESCRGPIFLVTSAVRARPIIQWCIAFNALIEQFNIATRDCFVVDGTGDRYRVAVDVAHVDSAWPSRVVARFNQRVAPAQ